MIQLSKRIQRVQPSATLAITAKAKALKAEGVDVLALSAGEPDFDTPAGIKAAAKAALDDGQTKYTPVPGTPALRSAVASWFSGEYGIDAKSDEVIVSNGGKQVIFNALCALLDPGDEALVLTPYWVSYPDMVYFCGASPVFVASKFDEGFIPSIASIEASITNRTRVLILNSPSNPAGIVFDRSWLRDLADLLLKNPKITVISDDIYRSLVYVDDYVSLLEVEPSLWDRTLVVSGVSKSHAMTGWRIGFGIGNSTLIQAMSRLQGASTSGACSLAQAGALHAVTEVKDEIDQMRATFKNRRDHILACLSAIPDVECLTPGGAFYAFPDFSAYMKGDVRDGVDLANHLLRSVNLAVVPGNAFGALNSLRVSFAYDEDTISQGIERLHQGLKQL